METQSHGCPTRDISVQCPRGWNEHEQAKPSVPHHPVNTCPSPPDVAYDCLKMSPSPPQVAYDCLKMSPALHALPCFLAFRPVNQPNLMLVSKIMPHLGYEYLFLSLNFFTIMYI